MAPERDVIEMQRLPDTKDPNKLVLAAVESRAFVTTNISTVTARPFSCTLAKWALRALSACAAISRIVPAEPRLDQNQKSRQRRDAADC
jgi:hypothetical protein